MAGELEQLQTTRTAILANLASGKTIASYTVAGVTVTKHSLTEQRELLTWVDAQIRALTPGGMFSLARVVGA